MSQKKCEHGKTAYYCKICPGKGICEHGQRKCTCVECGGSQICEHNHLRYRCVECGGSEICEHKHLKYTCKLCKGSQICEHGNRKDLCRECGGNCFCEHGVVKYTCKQCDGASLCPHKRVKSYCKECKGGSICEHNHVRSQCKLCGGGSICEHNILRNLCVICEGGSICEHKRVKSKCKLCKGASICEHNLERYHCSTCNPKILCVNCKAIRVLHSRFKPYCFRCFCVLNPDVDIPRRYRLKEHYVTEYLKESFPDVKMVFDKKVDGGCSVYRPDVLIDCLTHSVVVECDENKHRHGNYSCEEKRVYDLFEDLGDRPLVIVRFNPDGYTDDKNKKHKGCFIMTEKTQQIKVDKKEWDSRKILLKDVVEKHLKTVPENHLFIDYLFY